eukprot:3677643-Ditylum_brightwellii.AAC.1
MAPTQAEMGYQASLCELVMLEFAQEYTLSHEFVGIGAGPDSGFSNTRKLSAMKYEKAMAKDKDGWTKAIDKEHQRMVENDAWHPIKLKAVLKGAKVLTSAWACKLKSNGTKRSRTAKGMNRWMVSREQGQTRV